MLIIAVSEAALWLGLVTIALKSVDNVVRLAIVIKSVAKVWILLTTAVSEVAPWLTWLAILVKSVSNKARWAMVARSAARV